MLKERGIAREWVTQAVSEPARTERRDDGTTHHLKPISERDRRVLRVVTSPESEPPRVITAFFDRRAKREI